MKNLLVAIFMTVCIDLIDMLDMCSYATGECGKLARTLNQYKGIPQNLKDACMRACLFPADYYMKREEIYNQCERFLRKEGKP